MAVIQAPSEWTHEIPNVRFRSLATPSRGTRENAVWRVSFAAGAASAPHSLTREEIFVVLAGELTVTMQGRAQRAGVGDAIVVPADVEFSVTAHAASELLCCFPVGGQARLASGELISPPWAQ
ncbi:MAG TPA: cupin domain-containing protein [Polyangiales bacterium]|nr:cupin domain-containing protein [Polyangiales bacterium]